MRLRKVISATVMLILFAVYQHNGVAFTHVHYGEGGMPVTHSHPFSGAHSHSAAQLNIIALLSNSVAMESSQITALQPVFLQLEELLGERAAQMIPLKGGWTAGLRGPPCGC